MRIIDAATAREIDRLAAEEYHLDTLVLMENAGLRSADFIAEKIGPRDGKTVVSIVLGKGNNAGDGLVLARHLFNRGYSVRLFHLFATADFAPAAAVNYEIVKALNIEMTALKNEADLVTLKVALYSCRLIVDAVFGSGFQGQVSDHLAAVFRLLNDTKRPILSLDIPSGVNADTGEVSDPCLNATWTIAYGLPKIGNVLAAGGEKNGDLHVLDISFPPPLTAEGEHDDVLIDHDWVLNRCHPRKADTHKGHYGHILVAGGAPTMSGSILLAGQGALKTGAGLVTYLIPESIHQTIANQTLEAMTCPLPVNDEGSLSTAAADVILQQTGNKILVFGMGLTRHEDSKNLVKKILHHINCPLILDADALLALGDIEEPRRNNQPLILTPHPGEMARILHCTIREVQENRVDAVREAASRWQATVVLKGHRTLIATAAGKLLINTTGNPGMATGGMGDVLSGIIGGLLGQGLSPTDAAVLGVYFHGLAGDMAAAERGELGVTAGDIVTYLPNVLANYEKRTGRNEIHAL